MSNPYFRFKQFTVWHDRCAMKVGTDGVLIGAWCPLPKHQTSDSPIRVLDIGTGSGLIALMLAQRCPNAIIDAIDIDTDAISQAQENFDNSPWSDRLHAHHISLQDFTNHKSQIINHKYDVVVSNPPYFVNSLKNPDPQRELARHTDTLPYDKLFSCATSLLSIHGTFALVLPAEAESKIINLKSKIANSGLFASRLTRVFPKPGKPAKRLLMAFTKQDFHLIEDTLYIESEDSPRSNQYQLLTKDFYL